MGEILGLDAKSIAGKFETTSPAVLEGATTEVIVDMFSGSS